MSSPAKVDIAIVGAGASGIMLASALLRPPARLEVALVDPAPGGGPGFAGSDESLLLNTRVRNMSLDPRSPNGFLDWLDLHRPIPGGWSGEAFAPRPHYGGYLRHRLRILETRTPGLGATRALAEQAVAAERTAAGWSLRFASGGRLEAQTLVLATGLARPRPLLFHGRDAIEAFVQDDPWDEAALRSLRPGSHVLLVGSGPTALDVAASIWRREPEARVVAVSRHGLLPRTHGSPPPDAPVLKPPYPNSARELYAKLRAAADYVEGDPALRHGVFLGLRRIGAAIWAGLPQEERAMFLRHFRRYWEVERHRIPPDQAETVAKALSDGRLEIVRGRLAEAKALPSGDEARVALLTTAGPRALAVRRVINCTGPEPDPFRSRNPLLLDLLAQGAAAADPLGLGLHVDGDGAVLGSDAQPAAGLYALGPPTLGRFFEVLTAAEIRGQADRLAGKLLAERAVRPLEPLAQGHLASGGIELRIESTLPPVRRPKVVPRS